MNAAASASATADLPMSLRELHLLDFRSFNEGCFVPDPSGATVLTGPNGSGKTSVLEAVAYLGTQRSFRGSPKEAMIRNQASRAILRAQLDTGGRGVLVETELAAEGRSRAQVNRQTVQGRRQLAEAVPLTIFSPGDLALVQGGPSHRRDLLDDALRLLDPRAAQAADALERVLRQRAALLRQAGGRLTADVSATLDVWDDRLVQAAEILTAARLVLVDALAPPVAASYAALSSAHPGTGEPVVLTYQASWTGDLRQALVEARPGDLRRGVTTVGPHRDDLAVRLGGRDTRTQASQGEQRCMALALRLAVHRLATAHAGVPPLLLLDDVFSELDPQRARALVRELPGGQALLTTAVPLPDGVPVAEVVDVRALAGSARWP